VSIKIVSWNVNGYRACMGKGFFDYLNEEDPDILCLQETKANVSDLEDHHANPSGYHAIWHSAQKKGYSGTAIFTKKKPKWVSEGFGNPKYDCEGRVTMAEFDRFIVFSVYFPNGQRDEERLDYKLSFYKDFFKYLNELKKEGKQLIITGDYNTAHTEIDLANPKENETTSGFLPIERDWMDKVIGYGYADTFRHFHKQPHEYSWWSYRSRARERNVGWRIDYVFVNQELLPKVESAFIRQDVHGSDHCPVGIILSE